MRGKGTWRGRKRRGKWSSERGVGGGKRVRRAKEQRGKVEKSGRVED